MDRPLTAQHVMVTRPITLSPTTPVLHGISQLLRHRISGAPVVEERRKYAGVFSEMCCLRIVAASAKFAHESDTIPSVFARDVMNRKLVKLAPTMDVYQAIGYLLDHKISGAPVMDRQRRLLGTFSEKTCMSVLIEATYDQTPGGTVAQYMQSDENSTIGEELELMDIVQLFLDSHSRRLQVLRDGKLVGQISRRDALGAAHHVLRSSQYRDEVLRKLQQSDGEVSGDHLPVDHSDSALAEQIVTFIDYSARTITPKTDFLGIAQIFHDTPYRRLPVVESGELVGMVSRRDLLNAANNSMRFTPQHKNQPLYLSAFDDEPPIG